MMNLREGTAAEAGLDVRRLSRAYELLDQWADTGRVPGTAMAVARNGVMLPVHTAGSRKRGDGDEPMPADAVFLVASVTKPVTATALMLLVERGQVALQDRLCDLVPEFTGQGREHVRVLHLLTHTSGLPDMLPENTELRRSHAPLGEFVARICRTPLLFAPGTRISYQSMGTAMVGEVVERVTGMPLRDFCAREIFAPLGMGGTALGIRDDLESNLAPVCLPPEQQGTDWHWNSPYWRRLGVPWGGMFARAQDLLIFLQTFLNGGIYGGYRLLGANTVAAMLREQTCHLPLEDHADRLRHRWGLGWKLSDWVAELSHPGAFGHSGATGTLVGADPATGLAWVLLTTQPGAPLHYVANMLNAAVIQG